MVTASSRKTQVASLALILDAQYFDQDMSLGARAELSL